ncbi:hypothetical protein DSAG12_00843 [Promethearchaeum syntrophicum]|uniref:Uncharacterized protein n=1 Tax=Promethearchaeum syntrophicum TaxID=2594042 RepID=A0A5B9D8D8_9ARCH|nr:hypothetical protein [Candidatus Prometheoarchaeum syntrophicum]QEE15020.1 hypothetical protein DSAG12_00843 [Candidatus Prometheoarchaeum syntrophicum]
MALPIETYLNGISAFCVLLTGFYFGIRFIIHYNSLKKSLLPLIAGLGIGLAIFYLGPSTAFFYLLFTGENISYILYGFLSYFTLPLTLILAMYLGFDIFKPSWKKGVMIFFSIFAIIWWVSFLFLRDYVFEASDSIGVGDLMDISYVLPIGLPMVAIAILSAMFLLGGGFLSIARKIEDKTKRKKSLFLALGWVLFAIAGILDTFLAPSLIALARLTMLIGYLLIFSGFTPVYNKED